jgi:AI-2 transport protein TqsA
MNNAPGRLVAYLVAMAALFVILFGIQASASIINPILLAAVITVTVLPIPGRLTARGVPGWLALVLSILMVVLLLALVIGTVFFSATKLVTEIPVYMAKASQEAASELSPQAAGTTVQVITAIGPVVQGLLGTLGGMLLQFGLALFIFFFMISAALALPAPSRLGLDPNSQIIHRISELTADVRKYMTVLTGVNFLVGLSNTVLLLFLGVDYALLWGMLAWFMGYIPSVGFLIALIPPVLIAYAQYGLQTALIVLVGYILINGGVQNFIQPRIMGQSLRISPVVVFVGLFVWAFLLGGIGALLAVPLTLLVLIIMENFEGTRHLAVLMRYTGEEKQEERQEAARRVKGLWGKVTQTSRPDQESETGVK